MDFSSITFTYGVTFGKGDGSDSIDWDVDLTDEQEFALKKAVFTGEDPDDSGDSVLTALRDEVYNEIEDVEIGNFLECGDDYTSELQGDNEVDPDEVNRLVAARDAHTLEFFGLTELSEEELEEWDAWDVEDLPTVAEFDPDFEPESPFNQGWDLHVYFPSYDESDIELEDVTAFLAELNGMGDSATAAAVLEHCSGLFPEEDLAALAADLA